MLRFIGRLLKIDQLDSIERMDLSLTAGWAQRHAAWLVPAFLALGALAILFYVRWQSRGRPFARALLALCRAILLCLLLLFLADPALVVRLSHAPRPWLWVVFDGTDSMAIEDEYPETERQQLDASTALKKGTVPPGDADRSRENRSSERDSPLFQQPAKPARIDYVKALLRQRNENLFRQLAEKNRIKAYQFERPDGITQLTKRSGDDETNDPAEWAEQLSTRGNVTALGRALEDLASRQSGGQLAGVVIFSDFDQNSGPPPVDAARKLGAPVYTVGVGAAAAVDLAITLQAPLLMKKGERATFVATLRSSGLAGNTVPVRLSARPIAEAGPDGLPPASIPIEEKPVRIESEEQPLEFTWAPSETGRYLLAAEADPQPGELVTQNNRAEREVNIRDDFLRLMSIEYEPTWEWRFIKEVFHRDKLVGQRGFRTFLRSADPSVRRSNELFLSTLTPKRSDFFANDVIVLGDMPAAALGQRFCEMTREFVGKFGGGLVIASGPRFGPGQLAGTALADLLPVVVDSGAKVRDEKPFTPQLTADALALDFMQLGGDEAESTLAWNNLGQLPWYQPVSRLHPLATALAVHPGDKCVDGSSPQPIIAIRRYGRGEVVYLGFNETWRLRRKFGELYYRQFWGQMIHRLGLSHALGNQKRFVVRTDRQQYQPDDKVLVSVEAYSANYEPLSAADLEGHVLSAELTVPGSVPGERRTQSLTIPQFREGVFETRIPAVVPGEHKIAVRDPVTGEDAEAFFQVVNVSVERRSAVRNVALAREIAQATGGRSYDLTNVRELLSDFHPQPRPETSIRVFALWDNWLAFALVVTLMIGEWLLRKLVNLP